MKLLPRLMFVAWIAPYFTLHLAAQEPTHALYRRSAPERIEGLYTLSAIKSLPGKDPQLLFTPTGTKDGTQIILPLITVNNALQQGQSYKIVATVTRTSPQEAEALQMLIFLPADHGLTVPLWLNAPHHSGEPYGEVGFLYMDLPFGGTIAYL